jgi:hypothetical protein
MTTADSMTTLFGANLGKLIESLYCVIAMDFYKRKMIQQKINQIKIQNSNFTAREGRLSFPTSGFRTPATLKLNSHKNIVGGEMCLRGLVGQ